MASVDPRFARARATAQARSQRHRIFRVVTLFLALGGLLGGGLAGWWLLAGPGPSSHTGITAAPPVERGAAVPSDTTEGAGTAPRFIDLSGAPLLIDSGNAGQAAGPARIPRPEDGLPPGRGRGEILVIRDAMIPAGQRLDMTLPTSQEDFAIFRAQRSAVGAAKAAAPDISGATARRSRPRNVAEAHALVAQTRAAARDGPAGAAAIGAAALRLTLPEQRRRSYTDSVLRVTRPTAVETLLQREGLAAPAATSVAGAARTQFGLERLTAGNVLALRRLKPGAATGHLFAQAAFYGPDRYIGALARDGSAPGGNSDDIAANTAGITTAADPWLGRDFTAPTGAGDGNSDAAPDRTPRVLDAFYGAALRHGLPPRLVGQIIMMLSGAFDLDAEAGPEDRVTLVLSAEEADGAGDEDRAGGVLDRVLYVGLEGGTQARCYIYRRTPEDPPVCYGPGEDDTRSGPGGRATGEGGHKRIGGSGAITKLVNRIIAVESAGRADAENPRSSATGLGQFIEGTWLRMMRTYRPDLTAKRSRAELLALRTDPDLSREMVENLASEGAAYLRARGHEITAGRLYLAHFLGMEGADTALKADAGTPLRDLFGASVIEANPFLRGRDAGYAVQWAEAKMQGASDRVTVIREPEGLDAFRKAVDRLRAAG